MNCSRVDKDKKDKRTCARIYPYLFGMSSRAFDVGMFTEVASSGETIEFSLISLFFSFSTTRKAILCSEHHPVLSIKPGLSIFSLMTCLQTLIH